MIGTGATDDQQGIGEQAAQGAAYGFGGGVEQGAFGGMGSTEEAVNETDDSPGGQADEALEDEVKELRDAGPGMGFSWRAGTGFIFLHTLITLRIFVVCF
jgi:hypothetical protein